MNGHAGKTDPLYFLQLACRKTAERFGKPDVAGWTNGDFVRLSQELFEKSQVQMSVNTLKRIFRKIQTDEWYYPQQATRDAMAQYIGYPDWDTFVQESPPPAGQDAPPPVVTLPRFRRDRKWLFAVPFLLISGLVIITYISPVPGKKTRQPFQITCRNPIGRVPYTAFFDVKVTDPERMRKEGYWLQFGDGTREWLNPNLNFYSHFYEQPGRFIAVIQREDGIEVGDTLPVYLPSKGWTATVQLKQESTIRLFPVKLPATTRQLKLTKADIQATGADTTEKFTVKFINAYETGISGDNFELTTNVTASPPYPGQRCSEVMLWVFGKRTRHVISVTRSGCEHFGYRNAAEKQTWGQTGDMSYLNSELSKGGELKLVVRNKKMSFFINDRKSFDETYTFPLEQIYSVRIDFVGPGTVNSFHLKDLGTGKLFNGNF